MALTMRTSVNRTKAAFELIQADGRWPMAKNLRTTQEKQTDIR